MSAAQLHKLFRHFPSATLAGAVSLLLLSLVTMAPCQAGELHELNGLISNGGYALKKNGQTVFSKNLKTRFVPASTIKLLTSLAAIKILGPQYRFHTRIYYDREHKTLYIKGSGDPFLVSEKVDEIAAAIAGKGIEEIQDIVLDDSTFSLEHKETNGADQTTNPYNANCSALAVNFNALPISVIQGAKVTSPEQQTPYLSIMGQIGTDLSSGYHRVNIDAYPRCSSLPNGLLYSGQLFSALLARHGVSVNGAIKKGMVPPFIPLLHHYIAKETVQDLVKATLRSSNNFMANQLFLAVGVKQYGFPATWRKSRRAINNFIKTTLELDENDIRIDEGSGLSTKNAISPKAMLKILEHFKPFANLVPVKYGVRMKSGTLRDSGVFAYAGYITKGEQLNPFVILLNQKRNGRDKILKVLYRQ